MTPAIKPLLLHSTAGCSDGLKKELALLRSGELRSRHPEYVSRWADPRGRSSPVFLRLGTPLDIENLKTLGGTVVLALDARVLRAHAFQLNQGWYPEETGRAAIPCETPGKLINPSLVRGEVLDGRAMDDAALFAKLKAFDRARRRLFGLKASRVKGGCFIMSNEILVDSPVSLAESLRVVFVPTETPVADVSKLRALVAKRYPLARVEEYEYEEWAR